MKLTVKTLKGSHFEIRVSPNDSIMAVKKNIEDVQGKVTYPCGQQLLIHNGKVLKDDTSLADNNVGEDGFIVVMLSKSKPSTASGSASQASLHPPFFPNLTAAATLATSLASASEANAVKTPSPVGTTATNDRTTVADNASDTYGQAASNLVAGDNLENIIQEILDMGGGTWDRDTILRALRAAYNNPERAVEYLYSGIPASAEIAVPVASDQTSGQDANPASESNATRTASLTGLPNSSPLNLFPQAGLSSEGAASGGSLDFLRDNPQFQALRSMVQANPQILQPMLQELSKQNPQLLGLIQEHHAEFLQLISEPVEGAEGDLFEPADQDMPHAISVTPAEQEAIERLEAMGFDRPSVIEAFLACDRNEELAANYLLENAGDFED